MSAGTRITAVATIACLLTLGAAISGPAPAAEIGDGRGGAKLKRIGAFNFPIHVTRAPGRKNRKLLFVSEQRGIVRVLRRHKALRRPFLDIRSKVTNGGEQGLLSIAFDPDYTKNRRLYAYFVDRNGDIRVSQFRRKRNSKTRASSRARKVIKVPHTQAANHNGGTVAFGPDAMMYLATGDGGLGCDPNENAQNPRSLLGKLLRIDPRRRRGYRVPSDNPFLGPGKRDEIYAEGLRNPFRFSFDRRTRTIAIGDVGQNRFEEIDYETLAGARGANFGWDSFEGTAPLPSGACNFADPRTPPPSRHDEPIHQYAHQGPGHTGCSVTGGLVVRDRRIQSLYGRYLYADFCTGQLRSLIPRTDGARADRSLGVGVENPTSFGAGRAGRVYITSLTRGLFRLKPAS